MDLSLIGPSVTLGKNSTNQVELYQLGSGSIRRTMFGASGPRLMTRMRQDLAQEGALFLTFHRMQAAMRWVS
jgi:hypothetical protein